MASRSFPLGIRAHGYFQTAGRGAMSTKDKDEVHGEDAEGAGYIGLYKPTVMARALRQSADASDAAGPATFFLRKALIIPTAVYAWPASARSSSPKATGIVPVHLPTAGLFFSFSVFAVPKEPPLSEPDAELYRVLSLIPPIIPHNQSEWPTCYLPLLSSPTMRLSRP